ncbi:probable uracil-DNA glycosylase [Claviceps purpurea 20.1]|uniref:Uracil-DNA glycosylase n=1 Tax=Claviceps purpurea (strain 20.1) TaxID=1111077 RepID=M1WIU1_CLAP2|nr:probable uracil-DNA glycosylase [Claviceps purpurea 20.1]
MAAPKRKADESVPNAAETKKPKVNGSIASFFGAVPKPASAGNTAPGSPAVKFDKKKWEGGLTAEQKKLLQLEIDTLDESWLAHLKDEITSKEFLDLKRFLDKETSAGKKWFPPKEDVYSWSRHTPFHNVKVVIVGQDPYHNDNQAHGLAFSVRPPTPAPPSLKNMYIALKKDYPAFESPPNRGGLLTPWADRGVLMLNTCLTVRAHEANSHANRGWERFTQKVIDIVAQKRTQGVVFIAWGTPAGKRVQKIDRQKHLILQSVHPSPLSASRGFFDCGHFKAANAWLIKRYGQDGEIDWALTPGSSTKATPSHTAPASVAASAAVTGAAATVGAAAAEAAVKVGSKPAAQSKGSTQDKLVEEKQSLTPEDDDMDSEDEAALEEALRLAEEEAKKE